MRTARTVLTSLITAGVLAAPAAADAPNTAVREIVIGKSIGAAKIGMKRTAALKAWGYGTIDCQPGDGENFCFWEDDESLSSLRFAKGKLWSITIMAKKGKKGGFVREFTLAPEVRIGSGHPDVHQSLKQFPPKGTIKLTKKVDQVTSPNGTVTSFIYTGKKVTAIQITAPQ